MSVPSDPGGRTPASSPASEVTLLGSLHAIRAPLGIVVLSSVALLVPPQTKDMLAALGDGRDSVGSTISFHMALALLALSAWYWSRALLAATYDRADSKRAREELGSPAYDQLPRLMFAAVVLLGFGIIARSGTWSSLVYLIPWALVVGAGVYFRTTLESSLLACFGLERAADREATTGTKPDQEAREAEAQAGSRPELIANFCKRVRHAAWAARARLCMLVRRAPWWNIVSIIFIVASVCGFIWGAVDSPLKSVLPEQYPGLPALVAEAFRGPSIALLALAMIIAPLAVLTFLCDGLDISVPVLGEPLRFKPPALTLLVLWALVAPTVSSLHTVRIVEPAPGVMNPKEREDLATFFKTWVGACASDTGPVRPIIVAVSGGASRAAVWGERVLYEVERVSYEIEQTAQQGSSRPPRIFAVSSVSGGSLGVAAYMAALAELPSACQRDQAGARNKQMAFLTSPQLAGDALGPLLGGFLLVDIPRALLGPVSERVQPRGGDRAEALERAFEMRWRQVSLEGRRPEVDFDRPYLTLFYRPGEGTGGKPGWQIRDGMPLWIANGTDMESGNRLMTVPFEPIHKEIGDAPPKPGKGDDWPFAAAADTLAALNADVRISTAINNTARFPYLEPAGELHPDESHSQDPPALNKRHQPEGTAREIIDGGYFENEGLQTALDLASWLERVAPSLIGGRTVEPIIVQATADGDVVPSEDVVRCEPRKEDPTAIAFTTRPLQFLAPVSGLYSVRGGHSAVLLRAARAKYCADDKDKRLAYRCDEPNGLPVRCIPLDPTRQRFFHFFLAADGAEPVPLNWVLSDSTARYIWDGAMRTAGNPREAWALGEALKSR